MCSLHPFTVLTKRLKKFSHLVIVTTFKKLVKMIKCALTETNEAVFSYLKLLEF